MLCDNAKPMNKLALLNNFCIVYDIMVQAVQMVQDFFNGEKKLRILVYISLFSFNHSQIRFGPFYPHHGPFWDPSVSPTPNIFNVNLAGTCGHITQKYNIISY